MVLLNAFFALLACFRYSNAAELTFSLPDSEKQCFYEEIDKGVSTNLEFQVIEGGNFDIDVIVKSPSGNTLYNDVKKQYDSFEWTTKEKGVYEMCFSNEFSSFTDKVVYIDFQAGEEAPLIPGMEHSTPLTLMESSAVAVHESLKVVSDYQTHHKLKEASGRIFAEDVHNRVLVWSALEFGVIISIMLTQVLMIRGFFAGKKDRTTT